ncbi:hypothetical protein B0H14DRAFT_2659497, partial [Mycena olivaceomarginata]
FKLFDNFWISWMWIVEGRSGLQSLPTSSHVGVGCARYAAVGGWARALRLTGSHYDGMLTRGVRANPRERRLNSVYSGALGRACVPTQTFGVAGSISGAAHSLADHLHLVGNVGNTVTIAVSTVSLFPPVLATLTSILKSRIFHAEPRARGAF